MAYTRDILGWLPALAFEASDEINSNKLILQNELIGQYHVMLCNLLFHYKFHKI